MQLIPTILCGGADSHFWPVSRELHPKPSGRLAARRELTQLARTAPPALLVSDVTVIGAHIGHEPVNMP